MKNSEALALIREKLQQKLDEHGWGFKLRPVNPGTECAIWIKAKDVIDKAIEPASCQLITGGKNIDPEGFGKLSDVQERLNHAITQLTAYASQCGLNGNGTFSTNLSDPVQELVERYKAQLKESQLADEVFKWKLVKQFKGKPNLEAPDFYEEIKGIDYSKFMYMNGARVIKHLAKDRPEQYRDCFKLLFNEDLPLADRLKRFPAEVLRIYRELQPDSTQSTHHDERTIATLLTYHNPDKYTFYMDSFYQKYCALVGIQPKKAGEKYIHYLDLLDNFIAEYVAPDKELLDKVRELLPEDAYPDRNHKLLAQDIFYSMLDSKTSDDLQFQKNENELKDILKKSSPDNVYTFFKTLDKLIEDLSIPDATNLVFSTSNKLSFQIGKRFCLNIERDQFYFIAPKDYLIEGIEKTSFDGKGHPTWFHKASASIVTEHYAAIKEAVQVELESKKNTDAKKYDNAAFRKAAFDKNYRASLIGFQEDKAMVSEIKKDNSSRVNLPLNIILYGPPGTGKTYNTIELAVELITGKKDTAHSINKKTFDLLKKEGQVEFITFHQNYSYEDFVIGIKPDLDHADLKFRKNEGIFYQLCERAKNNYYQSQIPASSSSLRPFDEVYEVLTSPLVEDGDEVEVEMKSGKILKIIEINGNSIRLRYPSGSEEHTMNKGTLKKAYEDVEAFVSKKIITGGMYTYYKPILERLWEMGKQTNVVTPLRNYVLVIDEINRANISRVFGELITLLEEDKRLGAENELKLTLPNGEQDFALPPNLYILGTMNTADKSIALVDIALRRRFEFRGFYPTKATIDALAAEGKVHDDVPALLAAINKKIFDKKGADFLVGHAYFINELTDTDLVKTIKRKVIPLLMEYFSGKIDIVRELFSNSGYTIAYDTDNYDWAIAKA
ncbi:McrB family protein [Pontibacter pamirensis]|uniref:McrB family protein n=1 Tax=Pontibacter pamirensis TaxID=2562824 RepID=UPI001389F472|nr:AAA family ATPase [Pontibacter pamirensis]